MIVDTSVIVALAMREASREWIHAALAARGSERLRMSCVNIAETGMVLERCAPGSAAGLHKALAAIGIEPLDSDAQVVDAAVKARARFPLNFGDCFAYAHALLRQEALITLDDDFLATDLPSIVHPER